MQSQSELQMSLPLPDDAWTEDALREAHRAAHIRMPFENAMRDRALAICLRCFAQARTRRSLARGAKPAKKPRQNRG